MRRELFVLLLLVAPVVAFAGTDNCTQSSYARLRPPKYPAHAVAEKFEGKVLVAVVVEIDGSPGRLEVRNSSGNAELDQAALDSVAEWRFNPKRCDGNATRSMVVVPVEFSLEGYAPESDGNSDLLIKAAGRTVRIDRDPEPMEYSSFDEGLRLLRSDPGIQEHRMARGSLFFRDSDARIWELVEAFDGPTPAGPKRLLIRQRWREKPDSSVLLISALCDSTPAWCRGELASRMAYMEQNPPPPPPPK